MSLSNHLGYSVLLLFVSLAVILSVLPFKQKTSQMDDPHQQIENLSSDDTVTVNIQDKMDKDKDCEKMVEQSRYKYMPDGECCDVWPVNGHGLYSLNCNRVPGFPLGLEPIKTLYSSESEIPPVPFEKLAPKDGKFTFVIPELKYDGIWSKKNNPEGCCWTMAGKNSIAGTYGGRHLSRIPKHSMFEKTIISPPECLGLWPATPPPQIFAYDC
jgi:hypothetical protein